MIGSCSYGLKSITQHEINNDYSAQSADFLCFSRKLLNLRVERFSLASSVPQDGVDPPSLHGTGQLSASILNKKRKYKT
jgi:hypothetical protein